MRELLPGIFVIEGMVSNAYAIRGNDGFVLIDSGQPGRTSTILEQLAQAGLPPRELWFLVLTHAHFDHTGCAADLARRCGCQVLAHSAEVPFIEQAQPLPSRSRMTRTLLSLERSILPRTQPCRVDRALEEGDEVPGSGGYRCIHLPGHTPGSIGIYHPERRILFCGDVLFNRNPMTGQRGLRYPLPLVCSDVAQSRESVSKLSRLAMDTLFCGHGEAILRGASEAVDQLLSA
jgi:glyoxylase-like metal-dependent hydrolase (beta-lactamase superfamily II)